MPFRVYLPRAVVVVSSCFFFGIFFGSKGRKYRDTAQFPGGCGEKTFISSRLFEVGGSRGGRGIRCVGMGGISRRCDLAVTTSQHRGGLLLEPCEEWALGHSQVEGPAVMPSLRFPGRGPDGEDVDSWTHSPLSPSPQTSRAHVLTWWRRTSRTRGGKGARDRCELGGLLQTRKKVQCRGASLPLLSVWRRWFRVACTGGRDWLATNGFKQEEGEEALESGGGRSSRDFLNNGHRLGVREGPRLMRVGQ